uniref:C2 domain-containing protein n=1 Tax=Leersia perrieri TaxID=77586 RepID=A0A0D9V756_9ORYZ
MTKLSVEFCIISARGLGRRSTLLKPQWFSVAWIDPNRKYCTKIDASGNSDASWGTKFSLSVDEHDMGLQRMELTVEVYRREPIFLREHLQGTAVIQLKEYFDKFTQGEEPSGVTEETSSFQLRRKKSDKPQGFVDLSIRICKEENSCATLSGSQEGLKYPDQVGIALAIEDGPVYNYPPMPSSQLKDTQDADHYSNSMPVTTATHPKQSPSGSNYSYQPPMVPQLQPHPTSNPSFFTPQYPTMGQVPQTYINLPPRMGGQNSTPNFGIGLGAGALAAGTMIFGENLLSGQSLNTGLDGASISISNDTLF